MTYFESGACKITTHNCMFSFTKKVCYVFFLSHIHSAPPPPHPLLHQVDDGSTASLMEKMYKHAAEGLTVPQALRLAMLSLARRRVREHSMQQDEASAALRCQGEGNESSDAQGDDEMDGFRREEGGGERGESVGGLLREVEDFFPQSSSRDACLFANQCSMAEAWHMQEDESERTTYWNEFCRREGVTPKCVVDFPFEDNFPQGLKLSRDAPDERLLERMYCFEDLEDDLSGGCLLVEGGKRRRVILKVHTLLKWRDRRKARLWERASKVTAVKVTLLCVGCRV